MNHPVALHGQVRWAHSTDRSGRSAGMGVQIVAPPDSYVEFVRGLR